MCRYCNKSVWVILAIWQGDNFKMKRNGAVLCGRSLSFFLPYTDEIGDLTNFGFAKQGRIRNKIWFFYDERSLVMWQRETKHSYTFTWLFLLPFLKGILPQNLSHLSYNIHEVTKRWIPSSKVNYECETSKGFEQ